MTGWRSARSRWAHTPWSARAASCSRARGWASGPRWRRVRRSPVRCPPVSGGRARPRSSSARPSATGPRSGRTRGTYWRVMYGLTGFALTSLPVLAAGAALLVASLFVAPGDGLGEALRGAALALVAGHARLRARVRGGAAGRRTAAEPRSARGDASDAQQDRLAGLDRHAAHGPLTGDPLPAVRGAGHAGVAAAAGDADRQGRRGVDRPRAAQPDHGRRGRVPGRRHADRAVRARRRLDADRACGDRAAGVPRQLGDDRAGAQRAGRRAGGRVVGDAEEGEEGQLLPGAAAGEAAAEHGRAATRAGPTSRPRGCCGRVPWWSCAGSCRCSARRGWPC